ncbi:LysE family translocator [Actinomadura geliboluensis]|jgi:threonine/homoserine/homoserine lactone efflux protein|uniref:LysE family translocator n=1 Tax=Actinomadura geliboluensis TaxID=882440 RepID=A0A5S4H3M1_9ACTN|nr:LysE family translocator [Actinomadura geliboluensis]TMR39311.1 LysE family translocator [Actinomadura geliboluensis]
MISLTAAAAVAAFALGLVLTPGPNMIYLVSRTVTQGRRAGLVSLGGVAAGFVLYVAAATAGLTAVFTLVPALYTAIKIGGAAYLLWLAWQAVRPGGTAVFAPRELPADPPRRLFTMGLVTNLLNPKIAILYVSLLPQFADPARGNIALQIMLLGLVQITIAITVNGLIVLGAGGIAGFLARRPGWRRVQRYLMGSALAGLAVHIGLYRPAAA